MSPAALTLHLHHPLTVVPWRLKNCSWERMGREEDDSAAPAYGDLCSALEHPLTAVAATAQLRERKLRVCALTGAPAVLVSS